MALKEFIGKIVVSTKTGERYVLTEITAPEIVVATVTPGPYGCPRHYAYETINGDPISKGVLVCEDAALQEPFKAAYLTYSRTEAARWERYGYYLHRE